MWQLYTFFCVLLLLFQCRFRNLNSRCLITNSDLQCSHLLTDDKVPQDVSGIELDFSAPIVHIKSDVLQAVPLSLLAEATYVDSLLTALLALSGKEQDALAATPAHPVGLYALYASCLAGNLVEQLWNFAWPFCYSNDSS
ncbi:hypothetical protein P3X46_005566 [Hevea brasiliensis]|uniref:Nicastrin n=1 Tax=Hevea brasiliensis TaxID=3981 RepID=A0ABQ9N3V4_HEVBR|nr:hypothetical protein P3X46_005566 [Hevea brasiliensis]